MSSYGTRIRKLKAEVERLETVKAKPFAVSEDPAKFCEQLGFKPTAYQLKLLNDNNQFIAARWSRQSGKSHIVAARILWECLTKPEFNVLVVAPSLRQSKIIIRKITSFLRYLPKFVAPKPLKTKVEFYNGSRIQAFPNNPETIRGEPAVGLVLADELNYVRDDGELYDAVIFTLGTTDGRFLATSTPGSRDSLFYHMCFDPAYERFSRHHVSWRDAVEPFGPLKKNILEQIKSQYTSDPWRWTREMEAEFAEDEDSFFSMSLITKCVDQYLEPIPDSAFFGPVATG